MDWLEALILGLVQGLTEFLPVSSSGHLELGKALFEKNSEKSLLFTIVVHGATVLSTIVVFWKDLVQLLAGLFRFRWNDETAFIFKIFVSMIPVGILGLFFKDKIELLFTGNNVVFVGLMLIITSLLLALTYFSKFQDRKLTFLDSFVIGIAQACAVLPGISRSGATISTGLLLKNKRDIVIRFSFLMVLIPIIGENLLDIVKGEYAAEGGIGSTELITGFIAAFVSGLIACKWMINIVRKGRLVYFSVYCLIIGIIAIILG